MKEQLKIIAKILVFVELVAIIITALYYFLFSFDFFKIIIPLSIIIAVTTILAVLITPLFEWWMND